MSRNRHKSNQPSKPTALVDIVILVYNRFDILKDCLAKIPQAVNKAFEYNVILVDNASEKEPARTFYEGLDSSYIIIRNKENLGFPKGCNQGAKRKNSPLLLMLNSDVLLEPCSLEYLVKTMDDPTIGIAGMKLLFPHDITERGLNANIRPRGKVQHVGLTTNIRGEVVHQFLGWDADHPKVNAVRDVYMATGAAMLIRRSLWNKVGGFYAGYGRGTYEDCDLCLSARKLGYNIIVETKSVGLHYVGATAETYKIPYPMNMNRLIFMQRWGQTLSWEEWKNY